MHTGSAVIFFIILIYNLSAVWLYYSSRYTFVNNPSLRKADDIKFKVVATAGKCTDNTRNKDSYLLQRK